MYIERDKTLKPVADFNKNVKPHLNDRTVAEEHYEGKALKGWMIIDLIKKQM